MTTTVRSDLVAFAQTMTTAELRDSIAVNIGIGQARPVSDRAALAAARFVLSTRTDK